MVHSLLISLLLAPVAAFMAPLPISKMEMSKIAAVKSMPKIVMQSDAPSVQSEPEAVQETSEADEEPYEPFGTPVFALSKDDKLDLKAGEKAVYFYESWGDDDVKLDRLKVVLAARNGKGQSGRKLKQTQTDQELIEEFKKAYPGIAQSKIDEAQNWAVDLVARAR